MHLTLLIHAFTLHIAAASYQSIIISSNMATQLETFIGSNHWICGMTECKPGLEIGHFEKKTQGKKTQNSRKKLNNSRKKLKVLANFCRVVVQNDVFCY